MKKILMILIIGAFCYNTTLAQIPSIKIMEDYRLLVRALEPPKEVEPKAVVYWPYWTQDSIISIRDEISLSKIGALWRDSAVIKQKDSSLYRTIISIKNYKIPVSAKFGEKKPKKVREYYEEQRLLFLNANFDSAFAGKNKAEMNSVLNLFVLYYQEPILLAKSSEEDYQKSFVSMRQRYSKFLFECYQKKECSLKDINILLRYCTSAYPDFDLTKSILDNVYKDERAYLFFGAPLGDLQFNSVAEYYLAFLGLLNRNQVSNIQSRNDLIMRGYKKLFNLKAPYKDIYQKNIEKYLSAKYDIYL